MADKLKSWVDDASEHFKKVPIIKQLSQKTGVPVSYILMGSLFAILLVVASGIGSRLVVNMVGILYPAYMSFKAIESAEKDDDKLWLTYWVVFSAYCFVDRFADYLFFWVPFYQLFKLVVLVYMFWPQTKGALKVYTLLVYPFFKANKELFDHAFSAIGLRPRSEAEKKVESV